MTPAAAAVPEWDGSDAALASERSIPTARRPWLRPAAKGSSAMYRVGREMGRVDGGAVAAGSGRRCAVAASPLLCSLLPSNKRA